jgi:hypothetical protein
MKLLESKLFRFQHLSDETVSRLIAGELPPLLGFGARKHLCKMLALPISPRSLRAGGDAGH